MTVEPVTVELQKPHTHAGKDYAPGDTLELDEATARWMIERGVAKAVEPEPKKPTRKGD